MPESPPTEQATEPAKGGSLRGSTLWVTNVTKIVGLVLAVNEMLIRPETNSVRLAVCALLVAGAQVSETVLLSIIDRLTGKAG